MQKGLQIVLVGHLHGVVGGIDPLHRQLQRFAAAHRTHGGRGGIDFLRLCGGRGEHGVFGFSLEE